MTANVEDQSFVGEDLKQSKLDDARRKALFCYTLFKEQVNQNIYEEKANKLLKKCEAYQLHGKNNLVVFAQS